MEQCHSLKGWFGYFVQAILGIFCILTLVVKRQTEVPQRDWLVWLFDASKQSIGSSFGHFTNIFLSMTISIQITDECQWYCLSYLVDSSFGISLNFLFLTIVENTVMKLPRFAHIKFGDYGNPPSYTLFFSQLMIWLTIVVVTKIITYTIQVEFGEPLSVMMDFLLRETKSDPKLELVIVMIIIPVIVNSIQFWLTDMFLKHNTDNNGTNLPSSPLSLNGRGNTHFEMTDMDPDLDEQLLVEVYLFLLLFYKIIF
jgi:hypothetical protein